MCFILTVRDSQVIDDFLQIKERKDELKVDLQAVFFKKKIS